MTWRRRRRSRFPWRSSGPPVRAGHSEEWLPRLGDAIAARAPRLLEVGLGGGWAGLHEVTPDHNAIIGRSSSTPNLLDATGFSGHGFLQAPAVGEVIRDLHLDRPPFVDISPLTAERFTSGGLPDQRSTSFDDRQHGQPPGHRGAA
jgi:sarcosine oxidase subunit beta